MLTAKNANCILTSAIVRRDCNRQKHFGRGSAKNLLTICYFLEKGRMSKHGIMAGHNFFRRNSQPLTSHLQQSGKDESDKSFLGPSLFKRNHSESDIRMRARSPTGGENRFELPGIQKSTGSKLNLSSSARRRRQFENGNEERP